MNNQNEDKYNTNNNHNDDLDSNRLSLKQRIIKDLDVGFLLGFVFGAMVGAIIGVWILDAIIF